MRPPVYVRTDFIIARDGRIAAVCLLFDKLQFTEHRDADYAWELHADRDA